MVWRLDDPLPRTERGIPTKKPNVLHIQSKCEWCLLCVFCFIFVCLLFLPSHWCLVSVLGTHWRFYFDLSIRQPSFNQITAFQKWILSPSPIEMLASSKIVVDFGVFTLSLSEISFSAVCAMHLTHVEKPKKTSAGNANFVPQTKIKKTAFSSLHRLNVSPKLLSMYTIIWYIQFDGDTNEIKRYHKCQNHCECLFLLVYCVMSQKIVSIR